MEAHSAWPCSSLSHAGRCLWLERRAGAASKGWLGPVPFLQQACPSCPEPLAGRQQRAPVCRAGRWENGNLSDSTSQACWVMRGRRVKLYPPRPTSQHEGSIEFSGETYWTQPATRLRFPELPLSTGLTLPGTSCGLPRVSLSRVARWARPGAPE